MSILSLPTPRVFVPLLTPARYKGAHGGRGSGKSHFFAEQTIEDTLDGMRTVCIREIQKSIKQSVKLLLEDKIKALNLSANFNCLDDRLETPKGGLVIFQGMQDHTADSIKSLEGFDRAWGEEAQTLSARSIKLLRPTIRKPGSELRFSWNPELETNPIDELLRGPNKLQNAIVVEANWKHNPWFPDVLRDEMLADKARDYDSYLHVWEGHYRRNVEGAVYANEIRKAHEDKRVTKVLQIPGKPIETFWDLGKRDHTAIWFAQINMGEYRILDFYQNRGKDLPHYFEQIEKRKYQLGTIWLPHDAAQDRLTGSIDRLIRAQYPNNSVRVIDRMKRKAVGIEAVRRIFPNCVFDAEKTKPGLTALGNFKYDVDVDTGAYSQNPLHDENSDAADAFAQLALSLTEPKKPEPQINYAPQSFWAQ